MDLVSDFDISRAGMHRLVGRFMALFLQKEAQNAKDTKYSDFDNDRNRTHDRLSAVDFCRPTRH